MPLEAIGERVQERGRSWRSTLWPTRRTGELTWPACPSITWPFPHKTFGPHQGVLWGAAPTLRRLCSISPLHRGGAEEVEPGNPNYEPQRRRPLLRLPRSPGAARGARGSAGGADAAFDAIAAHEGLLAERLLAYLRSRPTPTSLAAATAWQPIACR